VRATLSATRHRIRRGAEKGVVLVELALALLPMCMVVFGAVDVGRAFITLDQLRNAAQAGALFARSYPTLVNPDLAVCAEPGGTGSIQYQVANEFNQSGPSGSGSLPAGYTLTVVDETTGTTLSGCGPDQASPPTVPSGDAVMVQVSAPFQLVTPLIGGIVGHVTLHGTSQVVIP
jgi:Flp pilus assembly protein TadG